MEEKGKVIRMNTNQFLTACSIIKGQCCNYDSTTGGCLLLDRGEVVQCPQVISQSLVCKFFRDVLLEDKRNQAFKLEIMGEDHRKVCTVCGQHFRALSNRAKYCARCARKRRLEQDRERKQKTRV